MPRQKNTRPTNIYWLYDTRPETVAVFGPEGQPFYCGKTVRTIEQRLYNHRCATRQHSSQTRARIIECGENIQTRLIEIVSPDINWADRERFWIAELRRINPESTNRSSGGAGAAGFLWTPEQRAALAEVRRHPRSVETRARMAEARSHKALANAIVQLPPDSAYTERLRRLAGNTAIERLQHFKRFGYLYA